MGYKYNVIYYLICFNVSKEIIREIKKKKLKNERNKKNYDEYILLDYQKSDD